MNQLLERCGKLSHLQYAKDGDWEHAVTLQRDEGTPGRSAVEAWLQASTDFALEMMFNDDRGLPHFIGVRWLNLPADGVARIIGKAHAILQAAAAGTSAPAVLTRLEDALQVHLLGGTPAFLELGVNNLWKSVGSLRVWQCHQATLQRDPLVHAISQHAPQLLLDQPNAVMLELGYPHPQAHWLGLCVSQPAGTCYRLELDAVVDIASHIRSRCTVPE